MAVMAIMFVMALPGLGAFTESSEQKEAARNVLAALRIARSSAITESLEYQVAFDLDSRCFWLERGDLASDSTTWSRVRGFGCFPSELRMATKKECDHISGDGDSSTADNKIQFNPNGTCGSSGSANSRYICVQDRDNTTQYRSGVPSSITGRAIIVHY